MAQKRKHYEIIDVDTNSECIVCFELKPTYDTGIWHTYQCDSTHTNESGERTQLVCRDCYDKARQLHRNRLNKCPICKQQTD